MTTFVGTIQYFATNTSPMRTSFVSVDADSPDDAHSKLMKANRTGRISYPPLELSEFNRRRAMLEEVWRRNDAERKSMSVPNKPAAPSNIRLGLFGMSYAL